MNNQDFIIAVAIAITFVGTLILLNRPTKQSSNVKRIIKKTN